MKSLNWRLAVAVWAALLIVLPVWSYARAQCPPGGCPAPNYVPIPHYLPDVVVERVAPVVEWRVLPGKPGLIGLYVDGVIRGELDPFEGTYANPGGKAVNIREFVYRNNPPKSGTGAVAPRQIEQKAEPKAPPKAGVCDCDNCPGGPDCKCGCSMPKKVADNRDNGPKPLFGVDRDRLRQSGERYQISGRETDRAEAMSAIEAAGDIPNDATLPRLTVIGTESARKAVLDDMKASPALAYWRDKLVVKDYPADHWRVRDGGFKTPAAAADAVVYVQKPDGTVLWRQDTYAGPDRLAKALRDKVPGYDPAKDPQPQPPAPLTPTPSPAPGPTVPTDFNLWWLAVPAALILYFLFQRRA